MSKKSWPILYRELLYEMGQDFLDIHKKNIQLNKNLIVFLVAEITCWAADSAEVKGTRDSNRELNNNE